MWGLERAYRLIFPLFEKFLEKALMYMYTKSSICGWEIMPELEGLVILHDDRLEVSKFSVLYNMSPFLKYFIMYHPCTI